MSTASEPAALIDIDHVTHYEYASPVEMAHHLAYLRPRDDALQQLLAYDLSIEPTPAQHRVDEDVYGNRRVCFSLSTAHESLQVAAHSRVRLLPRGADICAVRSLPWETVRERLAFHAGQAFEPAAEFSFPSPFIPLHGELRAYAQESFLPDRPLAEAAIELMQRIHRDFTYDPASTEISTPVLEAFVQRQGVCQDFAHVMIGCLRSLGLAARYVSGYLLTQPRPGETRLVGADASHAWLAVWCPLQADEDGTELPAHWLELDPTNDCLADTRHVRLAHGRDYGDVTPLRGVIRGGGKHRLSVRVTTLPG